MGWRCPACSFENDDSVIRCICGYEEGKELPVYSHETDKPQTVQLLRAESDPACDVGGNSWRCAQAIPRSSPSTSHGMTCLYRKGIEESVCGVSSGCFFALGVPALRGLRSNRAFGT